MRLCECDCGQQVGPKARFAHGHYLGNGALIHGRVYSRQREDYRELCRLCHNRYDRPWDGLTHGPDGRWVKR
jgi:hypothetical protein